jgi:hypothetical protein
VSLVFVVSFVPEAGGNVSAGCEHRARTTPRLFSHGVTVGLRGRK